MNLKKLSGGVDTLFGSGGKSSNSAESLTKQNPEMSGYMVKQGGLVKSWNRRYFILKDNQLHYYKDRTVNMHEPVSQFSLRIFIAPGQRTA